MNKFIVGLVIFILIAGFLNSDGSKEIHTVEAAQDALRGATFQWENDEGVKYGFPKMIDRLTFSDDAKKCSTSARSVQEENWKNVSEGTVALKAKKYLDTGGDYVAIFCSAVGWSITMNKSKEIFIADKYFGKKM